MIAELCLAAQGAAAAEILLAAREMCVRIAYVEIAGQTVGRKVGQLEVSILRRGLLMVGLWEAKKVLQRYRFELPSLIGGRGWSLGAHQFALFQVVVAAVRKTLSNLAE